MMIRHDRSTPSSARLQGPLLLAALLFVAPACNDAASPSGQANDEGTVLQDPNSALNAIGENYSFFVDSNFSGLASEVRLDGMSWGRLVDVYGFAGPVNDPDSDLVLMQEDFVVGPDIGLEGTGVYELTRNPVTGVEQLLILADVSEAEVDSGEAGRDRFFRLLRTAGDAVTPIFDTGAGGSGFFTFVPRNAAVVLKFDDLLDASTISEETIRVLVGVPSVLPFTPRIVADRNHGDLSSAGGGGQRFYTTRVILDTTINELESFEADLETPLPVNVVGLPGSVNVNQANVQVRIPTRTSPTTGQEVLLRNVTDHEVTTADNGSFDFNSPTRDLTRSFRSGGGTAVTGDDFNGFLRDDEPPSVLGSKLASIVGALPQQDPDDPFSFNIPELVFVSGACAQAARPGDVIQQPGIFLEVTTANALDGTTLTDVGVRFLEYPDEWDELAPDNPTSVWPGVALGQLQYLTVYDPATDAGNEACFLSISPAPTNFALSPATGLSTASTVSVRFSEAMDTSSVTAFDGITLTRTATPTTGSDFVVGTLTPSIDRRTFTFVPTLPLAHEEDSIESYFLTITQGTFAPTDLAGNDLEPTLPQVQLSIEPDAQTVENGGRVVRFTGPDEEAPFGDEDTGALPEWNGQHNFDLARQLIRPRPVTRFRATVDRQKPMPAAWQPYSNTAPAEPTVSLPLSPNGARMQTLWRVSDLGFDALETVFYNIDVEEVSWAPLGGDVLADVFNEFQVSLAHSNWLPDESFDPLTLGLFFPFSGLTKTFTGNLLDQTEDPLTVVHPGFEGYVIQPAEAFQTGNDQVLMPFPVNRDVNTNRYYTWRDTSILARGGEQGSGAPPANLSIVTGDTLELYNSPGSVQSIQLPLLLEFRCYPTDQGIGLNAFDVARVYFFGGPSGENPVFRAFSSGGTVGDLDINIDPDLQDEASGGFNPFSTPPGAPTNGTDNLSYFGGVDFVVRVSRTSSIWYPVLGSQGQGLPQSNLQPPVLVPTAEEQPVGTSVEIDFRAATVISEDDPQENAFTLDAYGDFQDGPLPWDGGNNGINFLNGDSTWTSDVSALEGAQYYQMRVTFVSNVQSGQSPELSAIGVAWTE